MFDINKADAKSLSFQFPEIDCVPFGSSPPLLKMNPFLMTKNFILTIIVKPYISEKDI